MKTGIIVYVIGNRKSDPDFDEQAAVLGLNLEADRVEFVFSGETAYDLADAWLSLTRKGMGRIICMAGELLAGSRIRLNGRELQLCGG
jgi:hypothetical protein